MLVAAAIFAVVALAISGQTLMAARQNRVSESRAVAVMIAQEQLECRRLLLVSGTCAPTVPAGYTVTFPTPPTTLPPTVIVNVAWSADPVGSVTITTLAN